MIFEECEQGLKVYIPHEEVMHEDTDQFVVILLKARMMYKRHAHADMDDDDTDGE